ncbi:Uncharacterized protein DBV15_07833 [Temnothorax longispinosus]|uniref:Uncharacterized protein n=1 Tax=Temnothorax longispinosus TaxID=300112 RepID=A0A4S2K110_9HYME|nr:Uncharacterized protein DBV15_07833 [Temnothorax longispinosus]
MERLVPMNRPQARVRRSTKERFRIDTNSLPTLDNYALDLYRTPGGSMPRARETLLLSRKPLRRGIDGSSAWRLLRHRRSPPPPTANTTRSGVTHRGRVILPLMRRYSEIRVIWIQVGASVFAPFLAALTSTLRDQSCFEAVEWPLYRVGTGEKWESRETPCHAMPRHATPYHAEAAQRNKTREMRRCDTAPRSNCHYLLEFVFVLPFSGAPKRMIGDEHLHPFKQQRIKEKKSIVRFKTIQYFDSIFPLLLYKQDNILHKHVETCAFLEEIGDTMNSSEYLHPSDQPLIVLIFEQLGLPHAVQTLLMNRI